MFEQEINIMVDGRDMYYVFNLFAFYFVFWPPPLVFFIFGLTYYYFHSFIRFWYYTFSTQCTYICIIKCKQYMNTHLSYMQVWFINLIVYFILYSFDFKLKKSNNYFNFTLSHSLLKLKARCLDANVISWVLYHNFIHSFSFICTYYSNLFCNVHFTVYQQWCYVTTIYDLCVLCTRWWWLQTLPETCWSCFIMHMNQFSKLEINLVIFMYFYLT